MKNITTYLSQFDAHHTSKTGEDYQSMFVSRQILIVQVAFWLGGGIHLFYCIRHFLPGQPQIPYSALTILFSCIPSYYFLKKNKLAYSFFFAYYPAIFFQTLLSIQRGQTNLNGELALIAYAVLPIVCFRLPFNIIGFLTNYLFFIIVKIFKYPLHSISLNEFYNEIILIKCLDKTI